MNSSNLEQLSMLSDGEMPRDALRFLLARVGEDPALAAAWSRYQIIGTTLRRQEQMLVDPGFSRAVAASLERADATAATSGHAFPATHTARQRWMRMAGGGAIAASVAALALFATRAPDGEPGLATRTAPTLAQEVKVPSSELHAPVATLPAASSDGMGQGSGLWDPRLQGYLMQHGQVVGQLGPSGFEPYVYFMATPAQMPPSADARSAATDAETRAR